MRRIFGAFVAVLLVALAQEAIAQSTIVQKVTKSCGSEVQTYCSQVTPGRGRLLSCLYAHEDKLSAQCINTLYDGLAMLERAVDSISYWVTQCDQDIDTYCAATEMGEGRIARCLLNHKADLSERCTSAIDEVGVTVE
jgi:hypothetical protein